MRGEYTWNTYPQTRFRELPPHARRIHCIGLTRKRLHGTTSACAENTKDQLLPMIEYRNYLRMRGEYHITLSRVDTTWELPPHARRIPNNFHTRYPVCGTTSACAENTSRRSCRSQTPRNYLRMRGEYTPDDCAFAPAGELPPHARRIP